MKKILMSIFVTLLLLGWMTIGEGLAQPISTGVKVGLVLDKQYYTNTTDEAIVAYLTLANLSGVDVITTEGFSKKLFHLHLFITDPDGKLITTNKFVDLGSPTPPAAEAVQIGGESVQTEPIEILGGDSNYWKWTFTFNVREFYTVNKSGKFSVKAKIPMRTYPGYETISGKNVARLGSANKQGFIESNIVNFTVMPTGAATGTINVRAEKHTVGTGSKPTVKKEPLYGLEVRVFDMSSDCIARIGNAKYGFSWQNYPAFYDSCQVAAPPGVTSQDNTARLSFQLKPGDYLIIGKTSDGIYVGSPGSLESGETMNKYLQLIVKSTGEKVPAKNTTVTGSELMIIQPEYVEWDGTQELYPFIFESVGDWNVTASVTPPEGFVADFSSLTSDVNSQLGAVQFTVSDVGSKWVPTDVTYVIRHNKKTKTINNKVGVKLTEKLAKKKALSVYGQ